MKKLCCLMLLAPLLTACSFVTLERQIYPICISVDVQADGRCCVGVQAPRAGGSSTGSASYAILTAVGDSFETALRTLSASTPYPLHFGQIRLCLIGYPLAAGGQLKALLQTLLELPTMRPTAYVSIALGSGLAVMQHQQPDFGMRLSTHLSLMLDRMQREHLLPGSTLSDCVRELSDGRSDLLIGVSAVNPRLQNQPPPKEADGQDASPALALGEPWSDTLIPPDLVAGLIPHTSENPVEYLGSAAVSGQSVAGVLTADETQLCIRLMREARRKTAREGDALQLQIHLPRESPLAHSQAQIIALMQTLQALGSDPLTFGCACSMGFATNADFERYQFRSRYPRAQVWVGVESR